MTASRQRRPLLRAPARDGWFLALSVLHPVLILAFPSVVLIGVLFWWHANTISHNFIHKVFFYPRWMNRVYIRWPVACSMPPMYWSTAIPQDWDCRSRMSSSYREHR